MYINKDNSIRITANNFTSYRIPSDVIHTHISNNNNNKFKSSNFNKTSNNNINKNGNFNPNMITNIINKNINNNNNTKIMSNSKTLNLREIKLPLKELQQSHSNSSHELTTSETYTASIPNFSNPISLPPPINQRSSY